MARTYHLSPTRRVVNRLVRALIRLGLAPQSMMLLIVRGRKSGTPYSTPVSLVIDQGQRWLVSPYGEVSWAKNARAAGQVTLSRRGRKETVRVIELEPDASAPVLKHYIAQEAVTRPFFDVTPGSSLEAFAAEAPRHPVFLIEPMQA